MRGKLNQRGRPLMRGRLNQHGRPLICVVISFRVRLNVRLRVKIINQLYSIARIQCRVTMYFFVVYYVLTLWFYITHIYNAEWLCTDGCLLWQLSRVCRRWYLLAWEPSLWSSISLAGDTVHADRALKQITKLLSRENTAGCVQLERVTHYIEIPGGGDIRVLEMYVFNFNSVDACLYWWRALGLLRTSELFITLTSL